MSNKGVKVLKECTEAWKEVQDDSHPVNFIILTFSKTRKKRVELKIKGAGGLYQALEHIDDEDTYFVGCRVSAVDAIKGEHDEDGDGEIDNVAVSIRPRFIKFGMHVFSIIIFSLSKLIFFTSSSLARHQFSSEKM